MREDRARAPRWAAMTRRRHRAAGAVLRATVRCSGWRRGPSGRSSSGARRARGRRCLPAPRPVPVGCVARLRQPVHLGDVPPPRDRRRSVTCGRADITDRERRVRAGRSTASPATCLRPRQVPRMALRAEYSAALDPDALVRVDVRDGRAWSGPSPITGWDTEGKFGQGTALPVPLEVDGYSGRVLALHPPAGGGLRVGPDAGRGVRIPVGRAPTPPCSNAYDRLGRQRFCEVRDQELVAAPVDMTA